MHCLLSLECLRHQEKENGPLSLLPSLLLFFFLILPFLLLPPSLGWMVNRSADVSCDRDSTDTLTGAVVITKARMASGYALSAPETSVPRDPRLLFLWSWLAIPSISLAYLCGPVENDVAFQTALLRPTQGLGPSVLTLSMGILHRPLSLSLQLGATRL